MAHIVLQVRSEALRQSLSQWLLALGHEVSPLPEAPLSPESLAQQIEPLGAEVVILDYVSEDAFSVKTMQLCRSVDPHQKFLFVPSPETRFSDLSFAFHEGALGFLPPPLQPELCQQLVRRALNSRRTEVQQALAWERSQNVALAAEAERATYQLQIQQAERVLARAAIFIHRQLQHCRETRLSSAILVVGDSDTQLSALRERLERVHLSMVTAKDGTEGLEQAKKLNPRVILSDLEMPGLNGLELCKAVKTAPQLGPTYFVLWTANQDRLPELLSPQSRIDDSLLKPSDEAGWTELLARLVLGLL